jgi:hypothetical protein
MKHWRVVSLSALSAYSALKSKSNTTDSRPAATRGPFRQATAPDVAELVRNGRVRNLEHKDDHDVLMCGIRRWLVYTGYVRCFALGAAQGGAWPRARITRPCPRIAPHSVHNFLPEVLSVPHLEQRISAPGAAGRPFENSRSLDRYFLSRELVSAGRHSKQDADKGSAASELERSVKRFIWVSAARSRSRSIRAEWIL